MATSSKTGVWSTPATHPVGGMRGQLARIDDAIEWARFDKFLRWLKAESVGQFGHQPLVMFKSLLLKEWFQLRAHDFELEVGDRASFRNFVGLSQSDSVPCHADVSLFGHLLWERGIGDELFSELTRQLTENRFRCELGEGMAANQAQDGRQPADGVLDTGLEYFGAQINFLRHGTETRPSEWREIESQFSAYWHKMARPDGYPQLSDIKIGETGILRPHLALIRVADDGEDFVYEYVGSRIEEQNGRMLVGRSLRQKAADNLKAFGTYGLQGELFALFRSALIKGRPIGSSVFFTNPTGQKCHLWSTVAPLADEEERVTMLFGAAYIEHVIVN
ncbi:transposase [Fodinicurvata sp. EGI_FJ10296]|uniref:transposase n=1 Tax=Fodinicurvata sp. EGI_FJ10296 TaxID=3231908 RepID=UPI0034520F6E